MCIVVVIKGLCLASPNFISKGNHWLSQYHNWVTELRGESLKEIVSHTCWWRTLMVTVMDAHWNFWGQTHKWHWIAMALTNFFIHTTYLCLLSLWLYVNLYCFTYVKTIYFSLGWKCVSRVHRVLRGFEPLHFITTILLEHLSWGN